MADGLDARVRGHDSLLSIAKSEILTCTKGGSIYDGPWLILGPFY